MKRFLTTMFALITILLLLVACNQANEGVENDPEQNNIEEQDNGDKSDDQNEVDDQAEQAASEEADYRIVSTTVALVEIMDQLEIDLAAVPTSYKELPTRYDGLPDIGNGMSPDVEMMMSLQPTEIMSVSTLKADLEDDLGRLDTDVIYYNLESLDNMLMEIETIGEKYNRTEQANDLIKVYENKVEEVATLTADKDGPSVLILLGVPGSYLIATDQSYIGDLVAKSGGTNVFSDEDVEYISVNTEHLQQTNPDVILRAAHGLPDEVVKMFDEEFKTNDIWKHFSAVENDRVYDLEETLFGTTANLAAVEAFDELIAMLYPEEN